MSADYFRLLRRMPVLAGLSDETLTLVTDSAVEVERDTDEYFFREGDNGDSLFVLQHGIVTVERNYQGTTIVLGTLKKGDCFGEMSLIDLMPRSAGVKAEEPCLALEVPHRCLHSLYRQNLEQYAIIMMNMGREVSRRLRITDQRLFDLEQRVPAFSP